MMMALAWADPHFEPSPALEFELWREATTVFPISGHGGCDPNGLAVTLRRRGLDPEIYVSRLGPYFLETVRSADKRRAMQLTQQEFQRESGELGVRTDLAAANESVLMSAFDADAVAIVLVSGYHMVRRRAPHWVFASGRDGCFVLVDDPAALRLGEGKGSAQTHADKGYAIPWPAFLQMTRFGRAELSAAILVRKGLLQ